MADTIVADPHAHHDDPHAHHEMSFTEKYIFPLDHKMIAMQYLFTGMLMAVIGGYFAYAFRMQLAFPGIDVPGYGIVSPAAYNGLVTNHGAIMIFWVAMPVLIAAFGNYLIPLMIGCDDMVFPQAEPPVVPDLPDLDHRAPVLVLRRGRRLRRRLDRLPAAVCKVAVQPHTVGLDSVSPGRRPRIRRPSCWAASTSSPPP